MKKNEFNELLKVDIRELVSKKFQYGMTMVGVLEPNIKDSTAVYIVNSDYMSLIYRCQTDDFTGYMKQKIFLDWQSIEYGNTNVHFICQECGKRTLVLYNSGISFMCRKCTIDYQSKCLTDKEQTARIYEKLEKGTIMDTVWI